MLIKLGADVNARDLTQCTPLQNAAHGTYSALATMPLNGSQGGASGVLDVTTCMRSINPSVLLLGVTAFVLHTNQDVFALIHLSTPAASFWPGLQQLVIVLLAAILYLRFLLVGCAHNS